MLPRHVTRRRRLITLALSVAAGLAAFLLIPKPLPELSREELIAEVKAGCVHSVVIVDGELIRATSTRRGAFRVVLPRGDTTLATELKAMGVEVKFETGSLGLI
jgi:hypothetical protein